jgi:hypothetical protein
MEEQNLTVTIAFPPDMRNRLTVTSHKNKFLTTLLTLVFGAFGLHRFYLYGWQDTWGWVHFASLPLSLGSMTMASDLPWIFTLSPLIISFIAALIEMFVIGLTPDEKWDARHNAHSGKQTHSRWPLAVLLVLSFGGGTTFFFFILARTIDLLYTGGSFG